MIKLLILDVDGVLTDGKIVYTASGEELKHFNVKDGFGIKMLQEAGIKTAIISGRHSDVTTIRAKELGIDVVHQGISDKLFVFHEMIHEMNFQADECAYIGDDYNDLAVLKVVGYAATVPESPEEVKLAVDEVVPVQGGNGAVRYFIELILKRNGQWNDILSQY